MNRKKILIAIDAARYGGAEIAAIRLANAFAEFYNVSIFILNESLLNPNVINLINTKVEVIYFLKNKPVLNIIFWKINGLMKILNGKEWRMQMKFKWVEKMLNERSFVLINSHSIYTDRFFSEIKKTPPIVSTLHGHYEDMNTKNPMFVQETVQLIQDKIKQFIYLNSSAPKLLQSYGYFDQKKFQKIYTGYISPIPLRITPRNENHIFTFGMIARGVEEKGWNEILNAFLTLYNKYQNVRLLLIGGGEFAKKVFEEIHLPPQNLQLIDQTNTPIKYIHEMDVAVLPSYGAFESLPNFIVESLFAGNPIIATNIGEISFMIDAESDSPSGVLIPLADNKKPDVIALSNAMEKYLIDKELYIRHQHNTQLSIKKFDMQMCVDKYLNVFNSL